MPPEDIASSAASPTLSAIVTTKDDTAARETSPERGDRAEALSNWLLELPDAEFGQAFSKLVGDDVADEERALLMEDLVSRHDALRLPYLVKLAAIDGHPFRDDARTLLESEIGDDYGTNTAGWADATLALLSERLPPGARPEGR
jgi:hypothetical protein